MSERFQSVRLVKKYEKIVRLSRELDAEMDGETCPASVAAILNAIRFTLEDIDDELDELAEERQAQG